MMRSEWAITKVEAQELSKAGIRIFIFAETLSADELATLKQARALMETKVAPVINKYLVEDAFPFELLPAFKELNLKLSRPCPWTTPTLVEICIGLEINVYLQRV
jgi:coenzyme PQQ precursor peptide PqqA